MMSKTLARVDLVLARELAVDENGATVRSGSMLAARAFDRGDQQIDRRLAVGVCDDLYPVGEGPVDRCRCTCSLLAVA